MSAWAIGFTFLFHAGKGGGGRWGGGPFAMNVVSIET